MRIDVFIYQKGYAGSRTEAKGLVLDGAVSVNGTSISKPSYDVSDNDDVHVNSSIKKYVSRGGYKLECALNTFSIDTKGKRAIDIGASSGGFTDCLLQNEVAHVIALDNGEGQLVSSLRVDERVTVVEKFNARYMKPDNFEYSPDLAVMDVSFISATLIFPALHSVLADGADFVCLIKPQFEVGKEWIGKGGIVRSEQARARAIEKVLESATLNGFEDRALVQSSILGGDGNVEYLAHFVNRK